jgi:BMFP domain-containing protein YqiC
MHGLEAFLAGGEYPGNRIIDGIIDRVAPPPAESYSRAQVRQMLLEGMGMMMVVAGQERREYKDLLVRTRQQLEDLRARTGSR